MKELSRTFNSVFLPPSFH
ncbi:hypothetical protein NDI37_25685 [Funiculus sociatus GB2-A5]|uniref:Uncharacterized protein n=1 Tax=Funiculus sociatus GB2-A5 TaxID=2933946 RepID=A0ABV0JWK0_9CYAN